MGGGNAFLRFSSSVAAGALILPQVVRAQECVKTYEGCGSCDNPELRFLTVVSSSENLTTIKYTNCGSEPFSNAVTLEDINDDIDALSGTLNQCVNTNDVSVVSFPCIIDNIQFRVDFDGQQTSLPRLEKIRFANLVDVDGFTIERMPALISISAPLLQSTSFGILINENNLLPKIDFPSLSGAGVVIRNNENLKIISLPQLTLIDGFIDVLGNPKLKKLCAPKLENGGFVCIGNNNDQPFLTADLSELVTGSLASGSLCSNSSAPTVCGKGTDGLFSTTGCPSNACS